MENDKTQTRVANHRIEAAAPPDEEDPGAAIATDADRPSSAADAQDDETRLGFRARPVVGMHRDPAAASGDEAGQPHPAADGDEQDRQDAGSADAPARESIPATRRIDHAHPLESGEAGFFGSAGWQEPSHRAIQAGDTLKGRFFLEEIIAEGGMGVVFKARDRIEATGGISDSFLAIKMLGKSFKPHPEAWKSLLSEAKKTKHLAHPNIIKVYDFDYDPEWEEYFMTMEYLQGKSLDQLIRENRGRPLEPRQAYFIIEGIARALEYAHANKLVHSDIKPSNVLITRDDVVKVLDFGIARVIRKGEAESEQTVFGVDKLHAYTVAYASLEIMKAYSPDPRDDVYALACIAYKLLSGRHPFGAEGETQGAVFARDTGLVPRPIKGLSKRQWRALARGLAFVRNERTATVTEFLNGILPRAKHVKLAVAGAASALIAALAIAWIQQASPGRDRTAASVPSVVASPEREGLALLAPFEREPATPAAWLADATQVRERLAVPPLRHAYPVQQRLNELILKFLDRSRTAHGGGDRTLADAYLNLAETLNVDPAYAERLRAARLELDREAAPPPASSPPSATGQDGLVQLLSRLNQVDVAPSKKIYRERELIKLDVNLPEASSLHVFHFRPGEKATLIFPNPLTRNNRVGPGPIHLPDDKRIRLIARPPFGKSWFIAVAEPNPVNLYRDSAKSRPKGEFLELSAEDLLGLLQEKQSDGSARIGHAEMTVCSAKGNCE